MSNAEHLIENAIVCLRDKKDYDYFSSDKNNISMVKQAFPNCEVKIALEQIWKMANEVCFSWFYHESFKQQITYTPIGGIGTSLS